MWQPGWERSLGENGHMYIYMAESLFYSPETFTTLLIGYTAIQNKKLKIRFINGPHFKKSFKKAGDFLKINKS